MAKVVEKVMIKKDVKKELKLPNIVGHVEVEEVDATKNDTKKDSLVPSTQSLDVEQEDDEDQNGVYFFCKHVIAAKSTRLWFGH